MSTVKFAAREAKRLGDEAMRLRNCAELGTVLGIVSGLTLVSLRPAMAMLVPKVAGLQ